MSKKHYDKKKIISLTIIGVSMFVLGFVFGQIWSLNEYTKTDKKHYTNTIKFWTVKKKTGQAFTKDENHALSIYRDQVNKCIETSLSQQELKTSQEIENKALNMSQDSTKLEIPYDSFSPEEQNVIKKVKKCNSMAKKHITKMDKRILNSAISKMQLQDIIKLRHGV